ncbi:serine protease inhibitor dipetalogastin-like [Trichogramma pretiosum]|uniref:serine protease inhibitor dipetalogastin-like n=1 Tax=Trichogramma pretiosum TaxID=7493 RepID=UPI0006C9C210|nr:serine protease inhibitor dipetalogastin-like [Trichogramma pretiosum]
MFKCLLLIVVLSTLASINVEANPSSGSKNCPCVIQLTTYRPLCASNGKSYVNDEVLECDKNCSNNDDIVKVHEGYCEDDPRSKICKCARPFIYSPVCGSDGHTYPNSWALNCDKKCYNKNDLEIVHDGRCEKNSTPKPKPGSKICRCNDHPYIKDPVCGSNGKTYPNSWALGCDKKCNNEKDLRPIHRGHCNEKHR